MRKALFVIVAILLLISLSACGGKSTSSGSGGKTYTLKLGTALGQDDPIYKGLVKFSNSVKQKTNGKVNVQIFGNGSLGEDNDLIEQAKEGANIAVVSDTGRLATMVPDMGILTAPYIVDNYEEAKKVTQSDLFKGWEKELQDKDNLDILSFDWYQGDRHFLTKKPINTPDDLQGLKIRTIDSPVATDTVKSLGASPSGEAWSEVYPAIQQGVIDGAEAQYPAIWSSKLYEVITDISKTSHFQLLTGIIVSKQWMDSLPENYQKILYDEAFKAGDEASKETEKTLSEYEEKLKDQGVKIHEVDKNLFKEKTEKVYKDIEGYEDLREQINRILGK